MNMLEILGFLPASITYISNMPYFSYSMVMTTICGMLIGAIIFNGDVKMMLKALIAIGFYSFIILASNLYRISLNVPEIGYKAIQSLYGTSTIIIVTFFYVTGILIGVFVTNKAHHKKI